MDILQLRDVRYTYQTQYQKVEALKGITHGGSTPSWASLAAAKPPCCP